GGGLNSQRALIMVFNAGSSSLKFARFQESASGNCFALIHGAVSHIGSNAEFIWRHGDRISQKLIDVHDYEYATEWILDWISHLWPLGTLINDIVMVAHRFVDGGGFFNDPVIVDNPTIDKLESLIPISPNQTPHALSALKVTQRHFSKSIPTVAVFDTAFFNHLPSYTNSTLPKLTEQYEHRYGLHGFAHRSMYRQLMALQGQHTSDTRVITFQLGSDCSVAAIKDDEPLYTSVGFSANESLSMPRKSGDIDPGIVAFLQNQGYEASAISNILFEESTLQRVYRNTSDIRELLNMQTTDEGAALSIMMLCYRARKYLGAYMAILQIVDAIAFGGGIGENVPEIRNRICADMAWCGIQLDEKRNQQYDGKQFMISSDDSKVSVYVIPPDEEILIAEDAKPLLPINHPTILLH
ncbi:MAG: hypothetical protein Q8J65_09800, partial [Nitrosomonadales bacterium]|nr:hypothetical protein [Nitrosomonadales bacterium]